MVISGTGRAGTTFLVELLTSLGLDTGFTSHEASKLPKASFGGLESDIRKPSAPYIVKSPWLCDYMDEVIASGDIELEHLIVPVRALRDAAESRRRVSAMGCAAGGLWHTKSVSEGEQERVLAQKLYKLVLSAASIHVPVTLLQFPLLALDQEYLFAKLSFLLKPAGVTFGDFSASFSLTSKSERIHFL